MAALKRIEQRIAALEQVLHMPPTEQDGTRQDVLQSAVDCNNAFMSTVKSKEKLAATLKAIDFKLLASSLDCTRGGEENMPDDVKLELINANERTVRERIALLEQVDANKDILDSEHLRPSPQMDASMRKLRLSQHKLLADGQDHTDRVSQLLRVYNLLIHDISRQFVAWDGILAEQEAKIGANA